ncbi:putative HTH transcriptional regulator [Clostridium beijerinckii]|nr:putative HTH transcriptional regulator [Clostridium beijerinckii]
MKLNVRKLEGNLWETYSAFANTKRGTIIIGVKEEKGKFYPIGVQNAEDIIKDLWDNINNSKKKRKHQFNDWCFLYNNWSLNGDIRYYHL